MSDATAKQNEEEKSNNKFSHITFKFTSPSNTFKKKSNPKKDPAQLSSTRLSSFLPTYHKSERNREQHSSGFVNLMFNQHEPLSVNSETNIENDSLKGERIYEDLGKLSSQEQLKANESSREDSQFKDHMSNCSNSLAKLVDMIHNTTKNRLESNTANLLNNYEEPVDSSLISTSAETYAIEPYYQEEELEMDADETSTEQQSELAETLNEDTEKSEIYQVNNKRILQVVSHESTTDSSSASSPSSSSSYSNNHLEGLYSNRKLIVNDKLKFKMIKSKPPFAFRDPINNNYKHIENITLKPFNCMFSTITNQSNENNLNQIDYESSACSSTSCSKSLSNQYFDQTHQEDKLNEYQSISSNVIENNSSENNKNNQSMMSSNNSSQFSYLNDEHALKQNFNYNRNKLISNMNVIKSEFFLNTSET
jgi:hypothetical protein